MAEITFFTNPMSRGQIARWALHEAGADYEAVIVDWNDKSDAFLAANPMGKVPTIIHHAAGGDRIVSEAAAICAYLAEIRPGADLLPHEEAVPPSALKIETAPEEHVMLGVGSYLRTMDTLEHHLAANRFVCGDRFTMADVYVGSHVDWGLHFGTFPKRDAFVAYAERCRARDAYRAGKAIDNTLIEEMSK